MAHCPTSVTKKSLTVSVRGAGGEAGSARRLRLVPSGTAVTVLDVLRAAEFGGRILQDADHDTHALPSPHELRPTEIVHGEAPRDAYRSQHSVARRLHGCGCELPADSRGCAMADNFSPPARGTSGAMCALTQKSSRAVRKNGAKDFPVERVPRIGPAAARCAAALRGFVEGLLRPATFRAVERQLLGKEAASTMAGWRPERQATSADERRSSAPQTVVTR